MPDDGRRTLPLWRAHWPMLLLAVTAGAVAAWARHHLFPALSWNRDEPVYLWQMELLLDGRLTGPDGGHPDLFLPWLSAAREGEMFTQYTLGWPLVLAAARLLTGSTTPALAAGAALAVSGTYALAQRLTGDRRLATLAGTLMVASPILAIQGGVHLAYLFTLGLGLWFGVLVLTGVEAGRRAWLWLIPAGVLLGWVFLTRPYDAVLWGLAFGAYGLIAARAHWPRALVRLVGCGLAALPLVALGLAYNARVTGSWLEFPITLADPLDTFGFGTKRLMPGFEPHEYTIASALRATAKNAVLLPWFLVGGYIGLAVAGAGLWARRHQRSTWALVLVGAAFPLGYLVFWGTHLSSMAARISGPIYFVPLFAPICILMAGALLSWWNDRRVLVRVVAASLVLVTVPLAVNRFAANRDISVRQEPWRTSLEGIEEPALIAVADTGRYLLYSNPFGANTPTLDGPRLFAALGSSEILDLIAEHPDRAAYVQSGSVAAPELGPREDPYDLQVSVSPATTISAPSLTLQAAASPSRGATHIFLTVDTGNDRWHHSGPVSDAPPRVRLAAEPASASAAPEVSVGSRGTVVVTLGFGDSAAAAQTNPTVRLLYPYRRIAGRVEVLLPPTAQRRFDLGDHHEWRHVAGVGELRVEVSDSPGL